MTSKPCKKLHKNPHVDVPEVLYHGTQATALKSIAEKGLLPRAEHKDWVSVHRTKTKYATFMTDEMLAAFTYARQSGTKPVVLEIDPNRIPEEIEPDYDDAKEVIEVDLGQLSHEIGGDWRVGQVIPPEWVSRVENAIEDLRDRQEDRAPFALATLAHGDQTYLVAEPYVAFGVADLDGAEELLDNVGDLYFIDGNPKVLVKQYLVRDRIPPKAIVAVWWEDPSGQRWITDYLSEPVEDENGELQWPILSMRREEVG